MQKKIRKPKLKRYLVHINEDFVTEVNATSVIGALIAAYALYESTNVASKLLNEGSWKVLNLEEHEKLQQVDDKGQVQS